MGEICLKHGYSPSLVIQRKDLSFIYQAGLVVGMCIVIRKYKNNLKQLPMRLILPMNCGCEVCCPVRAVQAYLADYTHNSGPLFQFQNGSPVTYAFVSEKMCIIILFLGLDQNRYKPQSFPIGAATSAYCQGVSEEDIKRMGRWESNAVQRYIRLNSFFFFFKGSRAKELSDISSIIRKSGSWLSLLATFFWKSLVVVKWM